MFYGTCMCLYERECDMYVMHYVYVYVYVCTCMCMYICVYLRMSRCLHTSLKYVYQLEICIYVLTYVAILSIADTKSPSTVF